MANTFAMLGIIKGDQSAVGVAAYIARANWTCDRLRKRHQYGRRREGLVSAELFLPNGSPTELRDPKRFWNAAEMAEFITDRKTKEFRLRKGAQLAKHMILALPYELDDGERDALLRDFVNEHMVRHGVGVLAAIHRPDDNRGLNWHAHLLITTRVVGPKGFGKKARHLNPDFCRNKGKKWSTLLCDDLPGTWRTFQNDWFRRRGLPYNVTPLSDTPARHHGRGLRADPEAIEDEKTQLGIWAKHRLLDVERLLALVTQHQSSFTEDDLLGLLRHRGHDDAEAARLARLALDLPGTKRLYAPDSLKPTGRYTWHVVWAEERQILDLARSLHRGGQGEKARAAAAVQAAGATASTGPQLQGAALDAVVSTISGRRLTLLPGEAGGARSAAVEVIRAHFAKLEDQDIRRKKKDGYKVIGLSRSPAEVAALKRPGFKTRRTWQAELARQAATDRPEKERWNEKTCVIVDHANLIDSPTLARLLDLAKSTGARLVLAGDETKPGTGRGGMFRVLRREFGYPASLDLQPLQADWAKAADQAFSAGRVGDAVAAYAAEDRLRWLDTDQQARDALINAWARNLHNSPFQDRLIVVGTRDNADALNLACQAMRWRGLKPQAAILPTAYGKVRLHPYDWIQFHAAYPDLGIEAGMLATAIELDDGILSVQTEDGRILTFNPRKVRHWSLGYAGTASIAPVKKAYLLYDDKDTWTASHLQWTLGGYTDDVELFVSRTQSEDQEALVRQLSAAGAAAPAHAWLIREDIDAIRAETERHTLELYLRGETVSLDLRQPAHLRTARRAFDLLSPTQASTLYKRVQEIRDHAARKGSPDLPGIETLQRQLNGVANTGGFRPSTGELNVPGLILPQIDIPEVEIDGSRIDVRGLLVDPYKVSDLHLSKACQYLYRFQASGLAAIIDHLGAAMDDYAGEFGLRGLLHCGRTLAKRMLAIVRRDDAGKRRSLEAKVAAFRQVEREDGTPRETAKLDDAIRAANRSVDDLLGDLAGSSQERSRSETKQESLKRLQQQKTNLERQFSRASALDKINLLLDLQEIDRQMAPIQQAVDAEVIAAARVRHEQAEAPANPPPKASSPPETKRERLASRQAQLQRTEKALTLAAGQERVDLTIRVEGFRMAIDLLSKEIEAEERARLATKEQATSSVAKPSPPTPPPPPTVAAAAASAGKQEPPSRKPPVVSPQKRPGEEDETR